MPHLLRLAATAAHGIFTAQQAAAHGVSPAMLRQLVRADECIRLRRGLYAFSNSHVDLPRLSNRQTLVRQLNDRSYPEDRHALLTRGILLQRAGTLAASHHSAAILTGLPVWGVDFRQPRFTRIGGQHTSSDRELVIGRPWPSDAWHLTEFGPLMKPAVACLQVAMTFGIEQGVVSIDAALASGLTTHLELRSWLDRIGGHRHCTRARDAVELANGLSESVGESRLRVRLHHLGYRGLQPQIEVVAGSRLIGRVDLFDKAHRIVIEFDGDGKYDGPQGRVRLRNEKRREDELRSWGLWSIRYGWNDLDREEVLRGRMERAIGQSRQAKSRTELLPGA
jgi:hypothetical protein